MPEPDPEALFAALAAREGICANLSIFNRVDVLAALVDLRVVRGDGEPQPLLVPAARLESLADGFLASRHVVALTPVATPPARSSPSSNASWPAIAMACTAARLRHLLSHRPSAPAAARAQRRATRPRARLVHQRASHQCAIGRAGAGKATTMAAARNAWQAAGWRVIGTAVKGEAARTLGAATGMPQRDPRLVPRPRRPLTAPLDARTVLVVDEASTVSDRDLDRLGWLAAHTGASLRLIGDPAQHGAVEAGGMFRVLCQHHPTHTPHLPLTHGVEDPHDRAAADALRAGDITATLDHLDAAGHLHIVDDELDFYRQALTRWWTARQTGKEHPIVDRRNTVRRQLNRLTHRLLQATGQISRDDSPPAATVASPSATASSPAPPTATSTHPDNPTPTSATVPLAPSSRCIKVALLLDLWVIGRAVGVGVRRGRAWRAR
jgi:AAA domain